MNANLCENWELVGKGKNRTIWDGLFRWNKKKRTCELWKKSESIPSCFLHFLNRWRTRVSEAVQRAKKKKKNPRATFLSFSLHYSLSPSLSISQPSLEVQNWASKVFLFLIKLCLAPSFIFYTKTNLLLFESYIQFIGLLGIITYNGTPSSVRIFLFIFRWV